ncbi:MAG: hypothetical protein AAF581_01410 [Planctomycetota bacterium]
MPTPSPSPVRRPTLPFVHGILVFCCILLAPQATATTVVVVDADRLVRDASQIVHVRCRSCESYRNDDGLIVTRYQFDVLETLKGTAVGTLECVQPGGRIGNLVTVVPGLMRYDAQQELILFLAPENANSDYRLPVGLDQGVYRIATDRGTGVRIARRDLSGLHTLSPADGQPAAARAFPEGLPVADFKSRVRDQVQRQKDSATGERSTGATQQGSHQTSERSKQ